MNERINIRFRGDVDGSPDLVTTAGRVAFWFSTSYMDRPAGFGHGAATIWNAHLWRVWWTKTRAVSVECVRQATEEERRG